MNVQKINLDNISKPVVHHTARRALYLSAISALACGVVDNKPVQNEKVIFDELNTNQHDITLNDIANNLGKLGYKANENNILIKKFTFKDKINLYKKYGSEAKYYKKLYSKPLEKNDIEWLRTFVETGKDKGKDLYKNNFEELFTKFLILNNNGSMLDFLTSSKENKDNYTLLESIVKNNPDKETLLSISKYKGKAYTGIGLKIQETLRRKINNVDYKGSDKIEKHIENISSYIDKNVVPESVKLYRGERCHASLMGIKVPEYKNIGHMMFKAAETRNKQVINKVREYFCDNEITVKVPGYMSTSTNRYVAEDFANQYMANDKVIWELKPDKNTKGIFVEGLYANGKFKRQNEVLLQQGSNIKVDDVDFDYDNGVWILRGSVSNK